MTTSFQVRYERPTMKRDDEERLKEYLEEGAAADAKEQEIKVMQDVGKMVHAALPADWGYVVIGFTFGEDSRWHYVSNANREDMVEVMREFIKMSEQNNS